MPDTTHRTGEPDDVLLVEDNPGDVRLVREAFDATGGETELHVVTDGDEAVDFLARRGVHQSASLPDIVLLDLNLPGKDGDEVLEAIRDDPRLRRLPVVVLSSSETDDDVARCYGADANAYLTKPTDPDEFVSVARAVERFWFDHVQLPPVAP